MLHTFPHAFNRVLLWWVAGVGGALGTAPTLFWALFWAPAGGRFDPASGRNVLAGCRENSGVAVNIFTAAGSLPAAAGKVQ